MGRSMERVSIIVRYPSPMPLADDWLPVTECDDPILFSSMFAVRWREENAVNIEGFALLTDNQAHAAASFPYDEYGDTYYLFHRK